MKNLKLLSSGHAQTVKDAQCFCIDPDSRNVYIGTQDAIYSLDKISNKTTKCADLKGDGKSDPGCVIGMEYLVDSQTIFLCLSSGDIFVYDLYSREIECVGTVVDVGVKSVAWSPDQEFLILLTGENTLIIMTKDFDPISENNLCPNEFGESKPINVGWGSKETQFHGTEGKDAAKVKKSIPKSAPCDDHCPRLSWRGDGECFVTSVFDPNEGYRKLRIWSRSGALQCTAEGKDGLEQAVCWRPSGNLITCTQQYANKHSIIFFEKNGLQHGEFTLPFEPNTYKVVELLWNSDSTILAMIAEQSIDSSNPCTQVQLWTCSNYHWYLKQKLCFEATSDSVHVRWDQEHPCKLHIYQKSGVYFEYTWSWTRFHSLEDEDSIVASVDNDKVLITPFKKMTVPPPMCAYSFKLPHSIDEVCFSIGNSSAFALYLSNKSLAFFYKDILKNATCENDCKLKLVAAGGNGFKSQVKPHNFLGIYNIKFTSSDITLSSLCHWTWIKDNTLLCIGYPFSSRKTCLLLSVKVPEFTSEEVTELEARCCQTLDNTVIGMCGNGDGSVVALQLSNGKVLRFDHDIIMPWLCDNDKDLVFLQPCSQISIISIHEKDYVLGLSDRLSLYCNDVVLMPNCTSYSIHDEFLLATSVDNTLKCFLINWDIPAVLKGKTLLTAEISSQRTERGAKIVTTTPNDTKVILQMPRGNLEAIHPRPLVLSSVCKHLENLQYDKAFSLSKLHRIDLNLLYDHNPKKFLDNVELVINLIDSPTSLNLLLASLQQEDVTETMYSAAYKGKLKPERMILENKIDTICSTFRMALEARSDDRYFQTLMATYAKKSPSELDKALLKIKAVKDSTILMPDVAQRLVDEALKFLLYLVDVSELLNVALGTYDFEIAIMVARKSQKDPKEFLPFFNELQRLEETHRKYKIDMHLQRYKLALQNISKCEEHFDECIALIKDQRLYTDALYLFPPSSDQYKIVWREYGNYLMQKRYFDEAGLVYSKCGEYEKALLAYKECSNWKLVLCSAQNLNYTDEQIIFLCYEMSGKLKENQRHLDSSYLLEHYVKDIEESISTLIEGCEWDSALLLISKYRRHDIAETNLKPALKDHVVSVNSHLDQLFADFNTHNERLKVLKQQKKQQSEIPDLLKMTDDDLFSETSSVSDLASSCAESKQLSGSILTRKSSKSRRKQKLKKYRLKEGAPNEDLALIEILSEIVVKVDNLKDNFLSTLKALVHFGYDDDAHSLQHSMHAMVQKIETEFSSIWSPTHNTTNQNQSEITFGPNATSNSIAAAMTKQKDASVSETDSEIAPPTWRRNMELTLQFFV